MDTSIPNAGKKWIFDACKAMTGLVDEENPDWKMKLYPGDDHTKSDDTPLDDLLLDDEVVHLIKTNHRQLLKDNFLFEDESEETLRMFFGEERDANLIRALFD